ncbi:MAG: microcin ABC transporter ATP-binding protein [Rhodospirillaceae bacterium]|nr:microcin ABC transporter ATP-binding protein [Rhodospirillaceae bacterium]|tara:strand:+ start:28 stop:1659 length:1632 start_codon:yes stop_codon:yes gene_type:complete
MTGSLLEVRDLDVSFGGAGSKIKAVNGVSFSMDAGRTLALVGESGSGKSVTALSILQLLPYPNASHSARSEIYFKGTQLVHADGKTLMNVRGDRISMIFQEPMTSLNPLHVIEKQISESLTLHSGAEGKRARDKCIELLEMVGIQNPGARLQSYPHQLSGGQRQRVMIAMALANQPDLLIADEPTTALDVTIQAQILELLKNLQKKLGMAILLITHDLGVVKKIADDVCVMSEGKIVEVNTVRRLFERPQHNYTQKLINSEPSGIPSPLTADAEKILDVRNLKVWFPIQKGILKRTIGHIKAVDGISLSIRVGETVGVVGESGSGKTTLGMAILRLLSSSGKIIFKGQSIDQLPSKSLRPLRCEMQVVFQDPFGSLSPRMSMAEIIGEGLRVHGVDSLGLVDEIDIERRIDETIEEVGLDLSMRNRYPHEFSGGQRQRISIARAVVLRPQLIVLDEPTSALDLSVQAQIVDLLRELQENHDLAFLFVSHDLKVVRAMSHRIIVMKDGVILEEGEAGKLIENPAHQYTKALMNAAFNQESSAGI